MKTLRITYVEDHRELREALAALMAGPGREVAAFDSAEAALSALGSGVPDLLVTDLSLPGMSGAALARVLLARNPALWVLLCSGYDHGQHMAALGCNVRVLPKPFEWTQLAALLDEMETSANVPDLRAR